MKRRTFVGLLSAGVSSAFAGCFGAATQRVGVGALREECPGDARPLSTLYRPDNPKYAKNSANGIHLTASSERVERGGQITFVATNKSNRAVSIPPRGAYAIQRKVDVGWRDVVWTSSGTQFGRGNQIGPRSALSWEVTMSEEALAGGDRYVCLPLEPGRYRFVFFTYETPVYMEFALVGRTDPPFQ